MLQEFFVTGATVLEQSQFVISQQGGRAGSTGEIENFVTVWSAINQIAEQNHPVFAGRRYARKQFREFEMTPVNVADGDKSAVHATEKC